MPLQSDSMEQINNLLMRVNLFGASGHAKVIMDILRNNGIEVGVLYDDAPHREEILGVPVLKASDSPIEGPLIISIGANNIRKSISARYQVKYARAVHTGSTISESAKIGKGSVVMPGTVIQADTSIGNHCIINSGASIDHECKIDDFVHVSPHATLCGNVQIGECSWIGAGAVVIQGVRIGRNSIIGAGSVVLNDIPDNVIAFGNPCKVIRQV